ERMIFDVDGQTLLRRVHRRLLGHGPALEHAVGFEAEIVMEPGGLVLLHDEDWLAVRLAGFSCWFEGRAEVTLRLIFFESHGRISRRRADRWARAVSAVLRIPR